MATIGLTCDQVLQAATQLPEVKRRQLASALMGVPTGEKAIELLEVLGPQFRLSPDRQKRLSTLLGKANAGTLTANERRELDGLVEEYESRRLELAKAVARQPSGESSSKSGRRANSSKRTKRAG